MTVNSPETCHVLYLLPALSLWNKITLESFKNIFDKCISNSYFKYFCKLENRFNIIISLSYKVLYINISPLI